MKGVTETVQSLKEVTLWEFSQEGSDSKGHHTIYKLAGRVSHFSHSVGFFQIFTKPARHGLKPQSFALARLDQLFIVVYL